MTEKLRVILEYHARTKHQYHAYARGPGFLDWKNQPKPFRRYSGTATIPLEKTFRHRSPAYERAIWLGQVISQPVNATSIAELLFNSLAISAWKSTGSEKWALRVNPSSGNLHPTEGYLICGSLSGFSQTPAVYHYATDEHLLEERATIPVEVWDNLTHQLPENVILVGLTSIFWREAWKYGERAFRYCQHDIGHAIAAISIAAGGLGWVARMLDGLSSRQIALLLGLQLESGPEAEYPETILAVYPQDEILHSCVLPPDVITQFEHLEWRGRPNNLSSSHREWPIIWDASKAVSKPPNPVKDSLEHISDHQIRIVDNATTYQVAPSLREIVRNRRSAVAMDGQTRINSTAFYKILRGTLSEPGRIPFLTIPWKPQVHLAIFVHLVDGLEPGLYFLIRDINRFVNIQDSMKGDFTWEVVPDKPDDLQLFKLAAGDARQLAKRISCHQEIAGNGCFSLGMIAHFETPLREHGAWFYPYLFWECGMIGQMLYLEAEAAGLRGTGIGCYFDDAMHSLLSIDNFEYQDLYHFTIGGSLEDVRLSTLPAYPKLP